MVQKTVLERTEISEIDENQYFFAKSNRVPPLSSQFWGLFSDRFLGGITVGGTHQVVENSDFFISEQRNFARRPNSGRKLIYFVTPDDKNPIF